MKDVPDLTKEILLVGNTIEDQWAFALQKAVSSLGEFHVTTQMSAVQEIARHRYDLIVIDAGVVDEIADLIAGLRSSQPEARIVVATASPTWQRAREAMLAGAIDYVRKSFNQRELHSQIQAALDCENPPC